MINPSGNVFARALRVFSNTARRLYKQSSNWVLKHKKMTLAVGGILSALILGLIIVLNINHNKANDVQLSPIGAEYQAKLPELEKAVSASPKDANARKSYGVALYATGDLNGAKEQYEEASKIDDTDAITFNNLGNTYRDLQEVDKAIEAYNKAIALNPKSLNSYSNLANVQMYSKNKPQDAIATYKKGLIQLPDNIQLLQLLAVAYEQSGDPANARTTYQNILKIEPENSAAASSLERIK
jgi:tetratricopeptide (TPR) repeat protein